MAALTRKGTSGPSSPLAQILLRYKRVGLDTICFIYHVSRHPQYLPLTQELFRLVEEGRLAAVTSSLALVEILTRPQQLGNHAAVESYKVALSTFPHLELRRSDIAITELAADLRARHGLSTPEAIQLATAIVDGADVFIGNSPPLRAVREIDVLLLDDLRPASVEADAAASTTSDGGA